MKIRKTVEPAVISVGPFGTINLEKLLTLFSRHCGRRNLRFYCIAFVLVGALRDHGDRKTLIDKIKKKVTSNGTTISPDRRKSTATIVI